MPGAASGPPRGTASFQASRLDVCCCVGAPKLPPPDQSEGFLLQFFRKFYVPFLLHRLTRVVVVSGAGGAAGGLPPPGQRGLAGSARGGVESLPGPRGSRTGEAGIQVCPAPEYSSLPP